MTLSLLVDTWRPQAWTDFEAHNTANFLAGVPKVVIDVFKDSTNQVS